MTFSFHISFVSNPSQVDEERLDLPVTGGEISGPYRVTYSEVAMTFAVFQVALGFFILWRSTKASQSNRRNKACSIRVAILTRAVF